MASIKKNDNDALISIPRAAGPHPPRWSPGDAAGFNLRTTVGEDDIGHLVNDTLANLLDQSNLGRSACASTEILACADSLSQADQTGSYIEHCPYTLRGRCQSASGSGTYCRDKIHFKRLVHMHTDVRLGDCSFLDSCDLRDRCPYVHYAAVVPEVAGSELDRQIMENGRVRGKAVGGLADDMRSDEGEIKTASGSSPDLQHLSNESSTPQWIRCDIRNIDLNILGKFGVVMADPPWDIRMTLPYGTVPDQAIIDLPFQSLQDCGVFFLWCTARSVDTGHACLKAWGYRFSDEISWVKVDHLRRLISVGRTGHWLNHTKEHCLVGLKGDPEWLRRGCDTDVIVAPPRATSHKPDEIYEMIERLAGTDIRRLEIFGREHNIRKGWLTIGNQLPSTFVHERNLKKNLMIYLAERDLSHTYDPEWNPWLQGSNRLGYGESSDWREERRISTKNAMTAARGRAFTRRGYRGGGGGNRTQQADTRQHYHHRNNYQRGGRDSHARFNGNHYPNSRAGAYHINTHPRRANIYEPPITGTYRGGGRGRGWNRGGTEDTRGGLGIHE